MPRRHRPPESAHVMRWMVSYADFVTLLLAFFVVLYTVSSVNQDKFEELKEALGGVFEDNVRTMAPIPLPAIFPEMMSNVGGAGSASNGTDQTGQEGSLQTFLQALKLHLDGRAYSLLETEYWLHLELPCDDIFEPQSDRISVNGSVILNQLAREFVTFDHFINVEVFNSPLPGDVKRDENLWRLSVMQAAAVTYHLMLEGMDPQRLAAVGYGPYQPIATSEDEEGQALNRRLVFLIDRTSTQRKRIKTVTKRHLSAKPNT